ncbi:MAG: hypothetical protein HY428_01145 [Candidatus Levybacteria bacterium]|nr:hypothetical protein [Candidatus Levybacteria bacterium]
METERLTRRNVKGGIRQELWSVAINQRANLIAGLGLLSDVQGRINGKGESHHDEQSPLGEVIGHEIVAATTDIIPAGRLTGSLPNEGVNTALTEPVQFGPNEAEYDADTTFEDANNLLPEAEGEEVPEVKIERRGGDITIEMFEPGSPAFYTYIAEMFDLRELYGDLPATWWKDRKFRARIVADTKPEHLKTEAVLEEATPEPDRRKEVDQSFYGVWAERFELPLKDEGDFEAIADHFHRQIDYGNTAFDLFMKELFPTNIEHDGPRVELQNLSAYEPSEILHDLLSNRVDSGYQYEEQRQMLDADISGQIEAIEKKYGLTKVLKRVEDLLDSELFVGKKGEVGSALYFRTWHDRDTNEVVRIDNRPRPVSENPPYARMKEHRFRTRPIRLLATPSQPQEIQEAMDTVIPATNGQKFRVASVQYHAGMKDRASGILKCLRRGVEAVAKGKPGIISPLFAMPDHMRLRLTINDTDELKSQLPAGTTDARVLLRDTVRTFVTDPVIQRRFGLHLDTSRGKNGIKEKNTTKRKLNTADRPEMLRDMICITIDDVPFQIEFMYYDREGFSNAQVKVGERTEDGWTGPAIELQNSTKLLGLVGVLLNKKFHGRPGDQPGEPTYLIAQARAHIDNMAQRIREQSIV